MDNGLNIVPAADTYIQAQSLPIGGDYQLLLIN